MPMPHGAIGISALPNKVEQKKFTITFAGIVTGVEAANEVEAWNVIRNHLDCYVNGYLVKENK